MNEVSPAPEHELAVWRDTLARVSAGQLAVEYLVVAALWRDRARNGLFAPDG